MEWLETYLNDGQNVPNDGFNDIQLDQDKFGSLNRSWRFNYEENAQMTIESTISGNIFSKINTGFPLKLAPRGTNKSTFYFLANIH